MTFRNLYIFNEKAARNPWAAPALALP